ncbi:MAG: hypothetical protein OHK0046_10060 [Anaerolineae bacterium]
MAKKFQKPTLAEVTYHYLGLFQQRVRQADFDRAEQMFHEALQRTNRIEDIRAALALDTTRRLPVQLKSPAYERMLSLAGRSPALLREYSQEMYDFGPLFTHYADMLWDEADDLEGIE